MRILFAANELHFPDNMGGSRMDIHDLALTFQEQGHEVAVLAAARGRTRLLGYRALETLTGRCLLQPRGRRERIRHHPVRVLADPSLRSRGA